MFRSAFLLAASLSLAGGTARADAWTVPPADTAAPVLAPFAPPEGSFDMLVAVEKALDLFDRFSAPERTLDEAVFALDLDHDAIFAFVRDAVRTEPYAGTLRAPGAVLSAGGANTQDKAFLLSDLLVSAGFDARIRRAPMAQATRAAIGTGACRAAGTGDPQVLRLAALSDDAVSRARSRATRDFLGLAQALDPLPAVEPGAGETHHHWVQVRADDGTWRDLDPALPDAEPGTAPTRTDVEAVAETSDPHTIRIRVVAESLKDGKLTEKVVLDEDFDARDAAGTPLSLIFSPVTGGAGGALAGALSRVVGETGQVRPALVVDGDMEYGRPFAAPGTGGSGGLLDAGATPTVVAVHLDLSVTVPGAEPRMERRTIVDLLPVAARTAETPPSDGDVRDPVMGKTFPRALESIRHILVAHGGLDAREAAGNAVRLLVAAPDLLIAARDGDIDPLDAIWIEWSGAHRHAVASEGLTRMQGASGEGACLVVDRPRVWLAGAQPMGDGRVSTWLDWAVDGIGVAGPADAVAVDGARIRLWHGAVQSALETTIVEWTAPDAEAELASTSILTAPPFARVEPDAEAARRDARSGHVLLAGADAPATAWWRVDPETGAADARLAAIGNAGKMITKLPGAGNYGKGIIHIGEGELSKMNADMARYQKKAIEDAVRKRSETYKEWQKRKRAERRATRRGGANEYLTVLENISIPASFYGGMTIGTVVFLLWAYSLL